MNINEESKYYASMQWFVSFEPSKRARSFMGSVKNKI